MFRLLLSDAQLILSLSLSLSRKYTNAETNRCKAHKSNGHICCFGYGMLVKRIYACCHSVIKLVFKSNYTFWSPCSLSKLSLRHWPIAQNWRPNWCRNLKMMSDQFLWQLFNWVGLKSFRNNHCKDIRSYLSRDLNTSDWFVNFCVRPTNSVIVQDRRIRTN